MIKTFGHQTIEKTSESIAQRIKLGPIKSTVLDQSGNPKPRPPFAGDGYYFWEDSIEAAEWWGAAKYIKKRKEYRIFRVDLFLKYDDNSFLDLIGSRQHLKLIGHLIRKTRMSIPCEGWTLEKFLSYFRILETRRPGVFPFKMIRFNDSTMNKKVQEPISLTEDYHVALMNPFYIICVFDIAHLNLSTFVSIK